MSSLFGAMLNPRISNAQLIDLVKHETDCKLRVIEAFGDGLDKCENNEQRMQYFNACMPVLMMIIF